MTQKHFLGKILAAPIAIGALVILIAIGAYLAYAIYQSKQVEQVRTPIAIAEPSDSSDTSDRLETPDQPEPSEPADEPNPVDETTNEKSISFERINITKSASRFKKPVNYVIRTQQEWDNFWIGALNIQIPSSTPVIDFTEYTVLATFYGESVCGTPSIQFSKIFETDKSINAYYSITVSDRGNMCATVITYPLDVVKIPQTNKEVIFMSL